MIQVVPPETEPKVMHTSEDRALAAWRLASGSDLHQTPSDRGNIE